MAVPERHGITAVNRSNVHDADVSVASGRDLRAAVLCEQWSRAARHQRVVRRGWATGKQRVGACGGADGYRHTLGVGLEQCGQLGTGNTTSQLLPTAATLTNVAAVAAAGNNATFALKGDGTVWGFGYNDYGQLGDGTQTSRQTPVAASGLSNVIAIAAGAQHVLALKSDGTVWAWGDNGSMQLGDGTTTQRRTPVQVTALG